MPPSSATALPDEAYLDLKSGRVDYVMADSAAISDGPLKKEGAMPSEFIGPKLTDPKWFGRGCRIGAPKADKDRKENSMLPSCPACQWQVQGNQRQNCLTSTCTA